jgi:alkylated DNA repair dioxygenase AlkB
MNTLFPSTNLLPFDGELYYYPNYFSIAKADEYFEVLFNQTPWQQDEVIMFGKKIITERKMCWYGTKDAAYTYSNIERIPLPLSLIHI